MRAFLCLVQTQGLHLWERTSDAKSCVCTDQHIAFALARCLFSQANSWQRCVNMFKSDENGTVEIICLASLWVFHASSCSSGPCREKLMWMHLTAWSCVSFIQFEVPVVHYGKIFTLKMRHSLAIQILNFWQAGNSWSPTLKDCTVVCLTALTW